MTQLYVGCLRGTVSSCHQTAETTLRSQAERPEVTGFGSGLIGQRAGARRRVPASLPRGHAMDGNRMISRDGMAGAIGRDGPPYRASGTDHTVGTSTGRGICSVCRIDLGPRNIPDGKVSHGYCLTHALEFLEEIDRDQPCPPERGERPANPVQKRIETIRTLLVRSQLGSGISSPPPR